MSMIALSLILAVAHPNDQTICAIGRVVLSDLATPVGHNNWEVFVTPEHAVSSLTLFDHCPRLLADLPQGVRLPSEEERHRAANHGPTAHGPAAAVYWIGAPILSANRLIATVTIRYECTGLCGGEYVQRYRRVGNDWRPDGGPKMKWVS